MRFVPRIAVETVEALLARYADAKYREPRWRARTFESHLESAHRHLAGVHVELADAESGASHAVHLLARAVFAVAQELTDGREPPDPLRFAIQSVDFAARALLTLAPDESRYSLYREIGGELLSVTARLRRLDAEARRARDGGVEWEIGDVAPSPRA